MRFVFVYMLKILDVLLQSDEVCSYTLNPKQVEFSQGKKVEHSFIKVKSNNWNKFERIVNI